MQFPQHLPSFFASFFSTSFMPHLGHFPGASFTTSGCIGQVYCCDVALVFAIPNAIGDLWIVVSRGPLPGGAADAEVASPAAMAAAMMVLMIDFMRFGFFLQILPQAPRRGISPCTSALRLPNNTPAQIETLEVSKNSSLHAPHHSSPRESEVPLNRRNSGL